MKNTHSCAVALYIKILEDHQSESLLTPKENELLVEFQKTENPHKYVCLDCTIYIKTIDGVTDVIGCFNECVPSKTSKGFRVFQPDEPLHKIVQFYHDTEGEMMVSIGSDVKYIYDLIMRDKTLSNYQKFILGCINFAERRNKQ